MWALVGRGPEKPMLVQVVIVVPLTLHLFVNQMAVGVVCTPAVVRVHPRHVTMWAYPMAPHAT